MANWSMGTAKCAKFALWCCLQLNSNRFYQILFSRKSTPIVFLYSAVKIPLQYFWIIEDFPTAPLPTITTWNDIKLWDWSRLIISSMMTKYYRGHNICACAFKHPWICKVLMLQVTVCSDTDTGRRLNSSNYECWIHQKPFEPLVGTI